MCSSDKKVYIAFFRQEGIRCVLQTRRYTLRFSDKKVYVVFFRQEGIHRLFETRRYMLCFSDKKVYIAFFRQEGIRCVFRQEGIRRVFQTTRAVNLSSQSRSTWRGSTCTREFQIQRIKDDNCQLEEEREW